MRFYKLDGSFTEDNDSDFGWYCGNILIDESSPNFAQKNKAYRKLERLKKIRKNLKEDSSSDSDFLEYENIVKPVILPNFEHCGENCRIGLEGSGIEDNFLKFEDINTDLPSKEELIKLIDPCNLEGKMLLAVISFARYKSLKNEEIFKNKSINQKTNNFKLYLNDEPKENFENELYKEIENYHALKEENMMSLMMELVLNDMDCKISDLSDKNFDVNTSDLGNSIHSNTSSKENLDSIDDESTNYFNKNSRTRLEVLNSLGLSEEERSIQSFTEETKDMHLQLKDVKESFKHESSRVQKILKQAHSMERNLKEANYLDNLLNLLNGNTEKVKLKNSPFKILIDPNQLPNELNLIV